MQPCAQIVLSHSNKQSTLQNAKCKTQNFPGIKRLRLKSSNQRTSSFKRYSSKVHAALFLQRTFDTPTVRGILQNFLTKIAVGQIRNTLIPKSKFPALVVFSVKTNDEKACHFVASRLLLPVKTLETFSLQEGEVSQ